MKKGLVITIILIGSFMMLYGWAIASNEGYFIPSTDKDFLPPISTEKLYPNSLTITNIISEVNEAKEQCENFGTPPAFHSLKLEIGWTDCMNDANSLEIELMERFNDRYGVP